MIGLLLDVDGQPCGALTTETPTDLAIQRLSEPTESSGNNKRIWGGLAGGAFYGLTPVPLEGAQFYIYLASIPGKQEKILFARQISGGADVAGSAPVRTAQTRQKDYLELLGLECIELFGDVASADPTQCVFCDCHKDGPTDAWFIPTITPSFQVST